MTSINNRKKTIPSNPKNPFKVPEGYFENLQDKILDNITRDDEAISSPTSRKIYLKPYLALAASISGLALIVYVILQSITGTRTDNNGYYDLVVLDKAGITLDDYFIAETYDLDERDAYAEWEEGAMTFLTSNEFDLLNLLDSN